MRHGSILCTPLLAMSLWAGGALAGADAPDETTRVLGPFLSRHWKLPLAPQGAAPPGFSKAETLLDAQVCGACHPKQWNEWRGSLHAAAFSPGFSGQLVEGGLAEPAEVRQCQTCHAPLGEQQPWNADLADEPTFDTALREQGINCAACHVRNQRRYGPPRRAELPEPTAALPHGGFEARPEFQESRFCAPCHQFLDDAGVNGKPIENTFREWQASPAAAAGRTCQSCHMPDRAHTWRGIHDPEMVRAAVDVDLVPVASESGEVAAALVVASRDVGHAFPTYVTPRVHLEIWQEDADGEIDGTRVAAVLGREIDFSASPAREIYDTRVQPGESVKLDYRMPPGPNAVAVVGRVRVDPGHHYRGVFDSLRESYEDPGARRAMEEAWRRSREVEYVLTEIRRTLPLTPP